MQSRHERILDLVERFLDAREAGQRVSVEQLCSDCPDLTDEVRRQLELQSRLGRAAGLGEPEGPAATPDRSVYSTAVPSGSAGVRAEEDVSATRPPGPDDHRAAGHGGDVPGYTLLGELGHGGMGVVYKARQVGLNRLVALKMILHGAADQEQLARFRTEAEAIARLSHPNIVQVFEIGEHNGSPYFSLELCLGGSLDRKLGGKPIDPHEAAKLAQTVSRAVDAAHGAKVVHRDIKPANVLLTEDGTPKVTDFGLARKLDELRQTQHGVVMGSPPYMPPEQATGDTQSLGPLVDVYALGATLYECLTGRPPFLGQTVYDTISQVVNDEVVPPSRLNPRVPRDLETVCLKALHKRPEGRYASAAALADDLGRFLEGRPVHARPAGRLERLLKWARRSPFQAAALGLGVAAVLGVLGAMAGMVWAYGAEARKAELELEKRDRLDESRDRITSLFVDAEKAESEARWADVVSAAGEALRRIEEEPDLASFGRSLPLRRLRDRALGELATAAERDGEVRRRAELARLHGDAMAYASGLTGLAPTENRRRMLAAISQGLGIYGIDPDKGEPPPLDPRFYHAAEAARVADRCCELLLLEADDLAVPEPGEPVGRLRRRLELALARIDTAHRVRGEAGPTRRGLTRRARFLAALKRPEEAEAASADAMRTPARLGIDLLFDGLTFVRQAEYDDALVPLSALLSEHPDSYAASYLLALCRLRLKRDSSGDLSAARDGLTRCLSLRPGSAWPLLLRGYAALEMKDWDAARADFAAVLKAPPDEETEYVARVNVGALHLKRGDWPAAIGTLEKAAAQRPEETAAYVNMALTYRQRAELPPWRHGLMRLAPMGAFAVLAVDAHQRQGRGEALAVLDEAIQRCPPSSQLHHERGRAHLSLGRRAEARDDFAKAIALVPTLRSPTLADDLIEMGRLLYEEGEYDDSHKAYQMALAVNERKTVAWRLMARPLLAMRKYEEAGEALDEFIRTVPVSQGQAPTPEQARTLAEALKVRGRVYEEQSRALRQRGALQLQAGDLRAALDSYTRGLGLSRDPVLLTLRGWTYLMCDSPALARADFDEALTLRQGDSEALIGRANARARLGQTSKALEDVERGVKAGPADARLLYNAARVHAQAVAALRDAPKQDGGAERSEKRAAELLGLALERTPEKERPAFWKQYVQADRAFDPIRRGSPMKALAAQIEKQPR